MKCFIDELEGEIVKTTELDYHVKLPDGILIFDKNQVVTEEELKADSDLAHMK